ncbi:MAG: iron transporter [Actinomycetota bacterium]|nr:iron transporter [Actinomycetota bacterium]
MSPEDSAEDIAATMEAEANQLELARAEGQAYRDALEHLIGEVAADGATQPGDDYLVGYAVHADEGMYEWSGDGLTWHDPQEGHVHLMIAVCDKSDGRFVPGLTVTGTLMDSDGNEVASQEHGLMWHPLLYHYGSNWEVPSGGPHSLRVRIGPPQFMRHDQIHGNRFLETDETVFEGVRLG